jgi:acetoin utilization protein AcuB
MVQFLLTYQKEFNIIPEEINMLVGERMHQPVISTTPDMPINDALNLMKRNKISRTPVVQNNKLIGIVSNEDLLNATPSTATSLSVWELNYLLSKITVKDVMTKNVFTVSESTPIEEAARIMADNQVGGLPVMRGSDLVGIITESDLFKIFLELMGARTPGVRVSVIMKDRPGQLASLTKTVTEAGGNFISLGTFAGDDASTRLLTFKVNGIAEESIRKLITPLIQRMVDIRTI